MTENDSARTLEDLAALESPGDITPGLARHVSVHLARALQESTRPQPDAAPRFPVAVIHGERLYLNEDPSLPEDPTMPTATAA